MTYIPSTVPLPKALEEFDDDGGKVEHYWPIERGDGWAKSFPFPHTYDRVRIHVIRYNPLLAIQSGTDLYKVCVGGQDVNGLERYFDNHIDVQKLFWAMPNPVTRAWLLANRFM